ncbi:SDR family oxidoreductase [Aspergillus mulundensis]|uniref:Toxin biosynthesis ketoreductase n=1 Tax=Aspergillus mulundensis TaxID=1810919 RepID=A0A3D8SM69_9EURO|nr:hypothetical protein DSM5745_03540 [Aspergillus mulundensis]RDW86898.1 hypothetical protein DSM5745_03540 [Aspergillus mulundensis]
MLTGIGKGLVTHYLAHPDTTVIATVRDPTSAKAKELYTLPRGNGSRLVIVALTADSPTSAADAASEIQTAHQIEHIDVVIANAGICEHWGPLVEAAESDVLSHFEVNTLGPLRLFKAMAPLLQKAAAPKFIYISTLLASIGGVGQMVTLTGPYGMSKAAGNFLVRKIHAENEHLVTLSIDPGLVQTDLGDRAAQNYGLKEAPVTLEESVRGITTQIDAVDKSTSGTFVNTRGEQVAW